ncbi:hypothetical protein [Kitasatospora sp. DSM 101779]|uniref:hypothetical protein n=1 Tax=Kitasatospora sp. DSM 101779 TaxID=2853165 RepID=UPI0021D9B99D|nr:hypothetical protein [Kitasatospora sp. DSM 101779]MCU7821427.1 hypothetical protein [Kitasatospora sp. DSM 101779]
MNGDPLYHWTALAVCTALLLPVPVAVLAGWTPPWMRQRQAGMRLRAYGVLCTYAIALVNGIPRIADAAVTTVTACTAVGVGFAAAAAVLFLLAERTDSGARSSGPVDHLQG